MDVFGVFTNALVLVLILPAILTLASKRAQRERRTRSLKKFTVCTPASYRTVFAVGAAAFEIIMVAIALFSFQAEGAMRTDLLWVAHACALACLVLWGASGIVRLDIDGDKVRYRTLLGRIRTCTISDIDKLVRSPGKSSIVRLYASGRRFATLSSDNTCMNNLIGRLENERVPILQGKEKPLSLWSAYKGSIAMGVGIWGGVSLFLGFVTVVVVIAKQVPPAWLVGLPFIWVGMFIVIVGGFSLICLRGLAQILTQQRMMGFSFTEEMRAREARGARWLDDVWFVDVAPGRIVAFRRDALRRLGAPRTDEDGALCKAEWAWGGNFTIRADASTLKSLRAWFAEKPREAAKKPYA